MAIAFRSSANGGAGFGNNGRTVAKPTGVVADDVLVALVYIEPLGTAVTAPSGWTLHQTQDSNASGDFTIRAYWKRAGSSEPTDYTWTWSGNLWSQITIAAYSGCITTGDPVDVDGSQASSSQSTSITAPSITTTVADAMLVFWGAIWGDRTYTPPSGMTERTGDNTQVALADAIQATAGASGSKTATASSSGWNAGLLLALKPASGGVTVNAGIAQIVATVVDPAVVLGSLTITAGTASLVAAVVDPKVVLGSLTIAPGAGAIIAIVVDPAVVLGSLVVGAGVAPLVAVVVDPAVAGGVTEGVGCLALSEALRDAVALSEAVLHAVALSETKREAVTVGDAACL